MSVNNTTLNGSTCLMGIGIISVKRQGERTSIPIFCSLSLSNWSIYGDG